MHNAGLVNPIDGVCLHTESLNAVWLQLPTVTSFPYSPWESGLGVFGVREISTTGERCNEENSAMQGLCTRWDEVKGGR